LPQQQQHIRNLHISYRSPHLSNSPLLLPTSSQSHWNFLHIRKNYRQVTTVSTTQSSLLFYFYFVIFIFFAISRPSLAIRHNRENIEKIQFPTKYSIRSQRNMSLTTQTSIPPYPTHSQVS
jgi:hypothetical protein